MCTSENIFALEMAGKDGKRGAPDKLHATTLKKSARPP